MARVPWCQARWDRHDGLDSDPVRDTGSTGGDDEEEPREGEGQAKSSERTRNIGLSAWMRKEAGICDRRSDKGDLLRKRGVSLSVIGRPNLPLYGH